jgi:hypothetical protein
MTGVHPDMATEHWEPEPERTLPDESIRASRESGFDYPRRLFPGYDGTSVAFWRDEDYETQRAAEILGKPSTYDLILDLHGDHDAAVPQEEQYGHHEDYTGIPRQHYLEQNDYVSGWEPSGHRIPDTYFDEYYWNHYGHALAAAVTPIPGFAPEINTAAASRRSQWLLEAGQKPPVFDVSHLYWKPEHCSPFVMAAKGLERVITELQPDVVSFTPKTALGQPVEPEAQPAITERSDATTWYFAPVLGALKGSVVIDLHNNGGLTREDYFRMNLDAESRYYQPERLLPEKAFPHILDPTVWKDGPRQQPPESPSSPEPEA